MAGAIQVVDDDIDRARFFGTFPHHRAEDAFHAAAPQEGAHPDL
jgi:hypothetical protein